MKKLITIFMLFGIAYGQGGYLKPNNSYGTRSNRVAPDSVLHIPILSDTLSLNSTQTWPQIRVVGDSLWWYKGKWRNLSLSVAPSEVWKLTGNAGTTDGVNFIGTTDNVPFNIRVNNQRAGRIDNVSLNTFLGYNAGSIIGSNNIAIGINTLGSGNGIKNVAIGNNSLYNNTFGGDNVAIGHEAMLSSVTASNSTAIGSKALTSNIGGTSNTAVGRLSLESNNNGSSNSGFGTQSLNSNTSGNSNTGIGYQSLFTNTTGTGNTVLGALADVMSPGLTNATAIGYKAAVNQSNSLVLGSINGINGASSNTKVGIGTTTPGWPLHVVGQVVMDGNVEITDHLEALGDVDTYGLLTANNGFTSVSEAFFNDKITVSTGPNPIAGTATLVAGTVTVNTDRVTTNSIIFLTKNTPAGVVGTQLSAPSASIVDNVSFIINSNSATETSTVNWFIIN